MVLALRWLFKIKYFYVIQMNDFLDAIGNEIVKTNMLFNELRNNVYETYCDISDYENKVDELMNYIKNTFIMQNQIDKYFDKIKKYAWLIKNNIDDISKLPQKNIRSK